MKRIEFWVATVHVWVLIDVPPENVELNVDELRLENVLENKLTELVVVVEVEKLKVVVRVFV